MTSEIRVNKLQNRVGLGTIEYSNTGPVISGVTTSNNFKTGTTNVHNVGIEAAGINVLGADTPIGTGATIYNSGAAVFTGVVTATSFSGSGDLDVDGHTNLDNVSIAGVVTATTIKSSNLTANRVVFTTTGGQLEASGNLTYNGTTLASGSPLDINSDLDVDGHTNLDNVSVAGVTTFSNRAYLTHDLTITGTAPRVIFTDTNNNSDYRINVDAGNFQVQDITNSFANRLNIDSNGKIGIGGETSPEYKVTVYDAGYSGITIKSNRNTATDNIGGLHFKTQTTNVAYIQSLVDGTIKFRNSSSLDERVRIKPTGELLVGTTNLINTSPSKFQVASNDATGSAILARFNASVYSSYLDFYKSRSNTLGTAYVVNDDDHLGAIRYYAADGSNSGYTTAAEIYGSCDGGSGAAGDMPGRITFHTRPDGAGQSMQERLRINSSGEVSIFDNSTAYYKPALNIKNTSHSAYGGAIVFTGENSSGNEYTQARIRTYGGTGTNDGALAIEAGNLNECARFKSGYMSIGGLTPNISGAKGLEISNAATTEIRLKNTSGGTGQADGFAIQKWNNGNNYIYDYDTNNIVFGVSNGSRTMMDSSGRWTFSPHGGISNGSSNSCISIVQTPASSIYAGISIKSTGTNGNNGMSVYAIDGNWDLYSRAGNQSGWGLLHNTASASGNARMMITEAGETCIGTDVYARLSTARKAHTVFHVTGGGLSIGPYGDTGSTREGGRYVLGWYMKTQTTSHSYVHLELNLWGGANPTGNTEYIMGGFHIHGHQYSGSGVSEERIYFHNWGGNLHGHSRHHTGTWDPGNNVYINSAGWVTLRLLAGSYRGYVIDLVQHAWYNVRDITIRSYQTSNSSSI